MDVSEQTEHASVLMLLTLGRRKMCCRSKFLKRVLQQQVGVSIQLCIDIGVSFIWMMSCTL